MKLNVHFLRVLVAAACALLRVAVAADTEAAPAASTVAVATVARPQSGCTPYRLDHVQRAVLERSAQGIDALRWYVYITRAVHPLDLQETVDWVVQYRADKAACAGQVAATADE